MSSKFGMNIKFSLFGQSHGRAVGVVVDRFPSGENINFEELEKFLARRKPGQSDLTTQRSESDMPVFLSGLNEKNITCGAPLCAIIENRDTRSKDYSEFLDKPRPGHADYTAFVKWHGDADMRGGGHFSARLTAPLCIAGGIAKQILERRGIFIHAHLIEVAGIRDKSFYDYSCMPHSFTPQMKNSPLVLDESIEEKMQLAIKSAAGNGDSVGGIVECIIDYPEEFTGVGEPMFDGVESQLAHVLFGIPAVKGVEFGAGFNAARMRGSENNDPFRIDDNGKIYTLTNNSGGILGGITNGMPIIFRTAFKPTPSISLPQKTVSISDKKNAELVIHGRHDPCVAVRAIPVVEAAAACVMLDMIS